MNKKYKAILFDWDGTAVLSRKAPVDDVLPPMIKLLSKGIKLAVISGTTYENIAGGRLHELIPANFQENLFMGLGRGVYNYDFKNGQPHLMSDATPNTVDKIKLHKLCFDIHTELIEKYGYDSDIVFTRPNYCKIDIMVNNNRGEMLFLQANEIDKVNADLAAHGFEGGLAALCEKAEKMGADYGLDIKATTDAKFIEVGTTTKSDNVNFLADHFFGMGIKIEEMAFLGDEYTYLGEGVLGSDSQMLTEKTKGADFFDVAPSPLRLPEGVVGLGGGIKRFEQFLCDQLDLK